jgi:hypothetical protein
MTEHYKINLASFAFFAGRVTLFGSYPITVRGQQEDLAQVLEQLKSESIGSRKKAIGRSGELRHSALRRCRTFCKNTLENSAGRCAARD